VLVAVDAAWEAAEAAAHDDAVDLAGLLDLRGEHDAHRIAFTRGDARVTVRAAGWPVPGTARRICRTAGDELAEIVRLDTGHGLLLHVDVLGGDA
jgi:hypothetical protein